MIKSIINAAITILVLSLLAYIIFYKVDAQAQGKASSKPNTTWSEGTKKLQKDMMAVGYSKKLSAYIINQCKSKAKNPRQCVVTASMIGKAESNAGNAANKNNVWGINEGKAYSSEEANFDRWLKSYNKHWFNSPLPSHYYPPKGKVSKTRYCTDEHSSKSKVGCPHGLRISTIVYEKLK